MGEGEVVVKSLPRRVNLNIDTDRWEQMDKIPASTKEDGADCRYWIQSAEEIAGGVDCGTHVAR